MVAGKDHGLAGGDDATPREGGCAARALRRGNGRGVRVLISASSSQDKSCASRHFLGSRFLSWEIPCIDGPSATCKATGYEIGAPQLTFEMKGTQKKTASGGFSRQDADGRPPVRHCRRQSKPSHRARHIYVRKNSPDVPATFEDQDRLIGIRTVTCANSPFPSEAKFDVRKVLEPGLPS